MTWARLILMLLVLLLAGTALADPVPNPTTRKGASIVSQVYKVMVGKGPANTIETWAVVISKVLAKSISILALIVFMSALAYRVYRLWLSEASASSLIYTVIRYAFIGAILSISNYYISEHQITATIKGRNSCSNRGVSVVLSYVGYCSWLNAYEAGQEVVESSGYDAIIADAVKDFTEALVTLLSAFEVIRIAKMVKELSTAGKVLTEMPKSAKPLGEAPPTQQKEPDPITGLLKSTGLMPFLIYLVLALPSVVLNFMIIVSGLTVIISVIFLPLAIALIAWGYEMPAINLGFNILAQSVAVYMMPIIFMIGFGYALKQPAAVLNGMSVYVEESVNNLVEQFSKTTDDSEKNAQNAVNQSTPNFWTDPVGTIKTEGGKLFTQIKNVIVGVIVTLVIVLITIFVSGIFFVVSMAISYSAGLSLITTIPNVILSMLGNSSIQGPNLYPPPLAGVGRMFRAR